MNLNDSIFFQQWAQRYQVVDWAYTTHSIPLSFTRYLHWVDQYGHQLPAYLKDGRKLKRNNIKDVYPDYKSAIVFLYSYDCRTDKDFPLAGFVSGFSGKDYHHWIKNSHQDFFSLVKAEGSDFISAVDVLPILERDFAHQAGLGWFGKNSMLISPKANIGSYFMIGSMLFNQELSLDSNKKIQTDHCGNCTACIQACPTVAIDEKTRTINYSQCISAFTIEEFKVSAVAPNGYENNDQYIFGCDICQDVCPWNKKIIQQSKLEAPLKQSDWLKTFFSRDQSDWVKELQNMSNNDFKRFFKGTAIARSSKKSFLKNVNKL